MRWMTGWVVRKGRLKAMGGALVAGVLMAAPADGQSPQFRGEPTHTGVLQTTGLTHLAGVLWRFETGGAVRSSPALVDGVVYAGSTDGHLYAVDGNTGRQMWAFDAHSPIGSSPAVAGEVVLISGRDNVLHGVDRATGHSLWRLETGPDLPLPWGHEGWDYIQSSPSLANRMAFWGSGNGTLHALDPATGEIHWEFTVASRIRNTPAVSGDLLVFGDSDGYVYALNARTGIQRWRFATDGVGYDSSEFGFDRRQVSASAVIAGDEIVIGGRDATVYSLNASDGSERWRFEDGSSWVITTAAVDDSRVFSARSSGGTVRAIDRSTGDEIWSFAAGGFVYASPVLIDDVLYLGQGDGEFSAHDAATGETLWSYWTGGAVYSTPTIHEGRAYVGSDDGYLYAFAGGEVAWHRAVYYDSTMSSQAILGRAPEHGETADYFSNRGYDRLDGSTLADFLRARISDGGRSVIVFGMDALPTDVIDGASPLLRQYLDTGGKVVWMGYLPGQIVVNDEGQITALTTDRPTEILGIDFSAHDGDSYAVTPTEVGRTWGLDDWWIGIATTMPDEVDSVLALNEQGRAVAWVRNYGGPSGTGFVLTRPSWSRPVLAQILRIAEFGLAGVNAGR